MARLIFSSEETAQNVTNIIATAYECPVETQGYRLEEWNYEKAANQNLWHCKKPSGIINGVDSDYVMGLIAEYDFEEVEICDPSWFAEE